MFPSQNQKSHAENATGNKGLMGARPLIPNFGTIRNNFPITCNNTLVFSLRWERVRSEDPQYNAQA